MNNDIQSVMPLIAKLARGFYTSLPYYAQRFMSVDDLIQHGCLKVLSEDYDPKRAAFTTFVQTIVTKEFCTLLERLNAGKRYADVVSMSEPWTPNWRASDPENGIVVTLEDFITTETYRGWKWA